MLMGALAAGAVGSVGLLPALAHAAAPESEACGCPPLGLFGAAS
jgi:hypothetical protein